MSSRLVKICLSFVLAALAGSALGDPSTAQEPNPAASMGEFCASLPRREYKNLNRLELQDKWFQAYEIAPGVTAIYEPHQWQEVISYLIVGSEGALLFDSGNGIGDIKTVVTSLTDQPIQVLNSHGHYDHVGGNYQFSDILGMDTEFTRQRQSGHHNEAIAIEVSPPALCAQLPIGVTQDNHVGRPYQISTYIKDGHIIDLGSRKLEVLHIPGHTPDAIALIDRQARLMWTGDSYYSGPIWLFAPETNLDQYRSSLDRMIAEIPSLDALLPAHNTPWVEPKVLLRAKNGFEAMLKGNSIAVPQGEGMVEHRIENEDTFSFLMRDEPLPYSK